MSIHLILGPMFSGKTTELLRVGKQHESAGMRVLYIKHVLDNRRCEMAPQGDNMQQQQPYIRTHDGKTSGKENNVLAIKRLSQAYDQMVDKRNPVICIDEGQFFGDLALIHLLANKYAKTFIVAALSATFTRKMFPAITHVLPCAEKVEWLSAVCFHCGAARPAPFTHRHRPVEDKHNYEVFVYVCN
jgi:thymidine kinase